MNRFLRLAWGVLTFDLPIFWWALPIALFGIWRASDSFFIGYRTAKADGPTCERIWTALKESEPEPEEREEPVLPRCVPMDEDDEADSEDFPTVAKRPILAPWNGNVPSAATCSESKASAR